FIYTLFFASSHISLLLFVFSSLRRPHLISTLFPYTTLFRSYMYVSDVILQQRNGEHGTTKNQMGTFDNAQRKTGRRSVGLWQKFYGSYVYDGLYDGIRMA